MKEEVYICLDDVNKKSSIMNKRILILIISTLSLSIGVRAQDSAHNGVDSTAILLDEVTISAGVNPVNKSPLRLKSISKQEISRISTGKTFPELLGFTPGVYATSESGSYGDARINIRGFEQENISVLLNGVPISGLTSGSMFWNNWIGLTDATAKIELQKGIGGSMLSDNSVGGTINIITLSPESKPHLNLGYSYTGFGTSKTFLDYNSGQLKNGWAVSLVASYATGEGYVQQTDLNAFSYLASVSKTFKKNHSLLFTALGSPERHEQRATRLSYDEILTYGRDYNKNWGYDQGEARTTNENNYFKPYFTLSHFWNTKTGKNDNIKVNMSNSAYLAIGNGGGLRTYSQDYSNSIISHQTNGQIDWSAVYEDNRQNYDPVHGYEAVNVMSQHMAGHTQAGLKSSTLFNFNDKVELDAGLHYQLYQTWEKKQLLDLLGGDYWYDAGNNTYDKVGDYLGGHNGRNMNYLTVYAMSSYYLADNKLILKLGASGSGSTVQRWDVYNYVDDVYSDTYLGAGGSIKAGALYKINNNNSIYLNAAAYSRTPYANVIFASGNNNISNDIKNEENYLGELGYRLVGRNYGMEATAYSALWKNKSLMSNPYIQDDKHMYMVSGLNAFHYGVEMDAFYRPIHWLKLEAFASIGEWKWLNDVSASFYDPVTSQLVNTLNIYTKGLHVGDAPQTQLGAALETNLFRALRDKHYFFQNSDLFVKLDWQFNDRFWSDFDPSSRTNPDDRSESYQIPAYHIFNLNISWQHRFSPKFALTVFCSINNLFDAFYIERGVDGAQHDLESFRGYWGLPRNYNFGIRLNF